jgi:hypothetical protein
MQLRNNKNMKPKRNKKKSAAKKIYASQKRNKDREHKLWRNPDGIDWALQEPDRSFGVYANTGVHSYKHNGKERFF